MQTLGQLVPLPVEVLLCKLIKHPWKGTYCFWWSILTFPNTPPMMIVMIASVTIFNSEE